MSNDCNVDMTIELVDRMLDHYRRQILEMVSLTEAVLAKMSSDDSKPEIAPRQTEAIARNTQTETPIATLTSAVESVANLPGVDAQIAGMTLENATVLQQQLSVLAQACTNLCVSQIYAVGTAETGKTVESIMDSDDD